MKIETHSCDDGKCLLCKQGVPRVGDLNAVRDVLELPAIAPLIATLASDAVSIMDQPNAKQVLTGAVDAEQAAGDEAENAKFPKP